MSRPPEVRRADKIMSGDRAREALAHGLHNTSAWGHLRDDVDFETRVCFEVGEPGEVFAYERLECDTSVSYASVVTFGQIRIIEDRHLKSRFFEDLMGKYSDAPSSGPRAFSRGSLDEVTVHAIAVERITGKETALPARSAQWPAQDRTKSPNARPPPS